MTEKCCRCGFPLEQTNQFVVMDDESYCMGCYQLVISFEDNGGSDD